MHEVTKENGALVIKGQVFKIRTLGDLVLMIVRLRCEKSLNEKTREKITLAGQRYGLLDTEGKVTSKYFAKVWQGRQT